MNIADLIRTYDFKWYYKLYQLSLNSPDYGFFFYFFARYGIVFFFLSFIYLIWRQKIPAFMSAIISMGLAGTIDFLVFIFWRRPRPYIAHSSIVPDPILRGMRIDQVSFPSSHTYIAFAIATTILLYGHKRLGSALLILALFVAIGRVGTGLHYPSDVIGGMLLGSASGLLVYTATKSLSAVKRD